MFVYMEDKNCFCNFNKNIIPVQEIQSSIYIFDKLVIYKINNKLTIRKNSKILYEIDFKESLTCVYYNKKNSSLAVTKENKYLVCLFKYDYKKDMIKKIEFSKFINKEFSSEHNFYYQLNENLIIYNDNKQYQMSKFIERFRFDNDIIAVTPKEKPNSFSELFRIKTNNHNYILCEKQSNVLLLVDEKNYVINKYKNHDCIIKKYYYDSSKNILLTSSAQNRICLWNVLHNEIKIWDDLKLSPRNHIKDLLISGNGQNIDVFFSCDGDYKECYSRYKIIKKKNKHKIKLIDDMVMVDQNQQHKKKQVLHGNEPIELDEKEIDKNIPVEKKENKKISEQLVEKISSLDESITNTGTLNRDFPKLIIPNNLIFNNKITIKLGTENQKSKDVFMGVDIGTRYSKVVIEFTGAKKIYTFPVLDSNDNPFFLTEAYINNEELLFDKNVLINIEDNYVTINYLKLRFEKDKNIRNILILYIVNLINYSKKYVEDWRSANSEMLGWKLDFDISIAFPENLHSNQNQSSFKYFMKLISTVECLLNSNSSIAISKLDQIFHESDYSEKNNKLKVVPESVAEIHSFLNVIKNFGQIILIDIGEGTTEMSMCWIDKEVSDTISVWGSKVLFKGVYDYEKHDKSRFKELIKSEFQKLLEESGAFSNGEICDNSGKFFVGGGGCNINGIVNKLNSLYVNSKKIELECEKLINVNKYANKHIFDNNISKKFNRFLVSLGAIVWSKNDYKIQTYEERVNKKRQEKPRKQKSKIETMKERARDNGVDGWIK